ncbi:YitT family protein [Anaerobacillus sp. MEB173]|uniref:YitT family protein n=1 Tax=Anaerobacillus sp. MEB173 TaxID=3383345 RepID=UPI003F937468
MLKKSSALFIGCFIISFSINNFFLPHNIIDGGIIGLALILYYQWEISIGVTIIVLSIPIYTYAWFYYREFFYNSIAGLILSALFIELFAFLTFSFLANQALSSAIIGGLLMGIGVGILFREDISTGGFDLFAQMFAEATKINVGIMILIVDLLAVAPGMFVISKDELILSTIAITATGLATTVVTIDMNNMERQISCENRS